MKKTLSLLTITMLLSNSLAVTSWDNVIDKEEKKVENEKVKVLNEQFKLEKFTTQGQFEKMLVDKMYDKVLDSCNYRTYYYGRYYPEEFMLDSADNVGISNGAITKKLSVSGVQSAIVKEDSVRGGDTSVSYGKTNTQKKNVDEPEILKLTKDYIAYFNSKIGKIYIIKSPVAKGNIDLNSVKITDTVKIPKLINKYNVKLFFVNNQLVVMGTRYSKAFGGQVTDLVFYKINGGKAKFARFYDVKGNFKDARIVNNKIYLITDYSFSNIVRKVCENYITSPIKKDVNNIRKSYQNKINDLYKKARNEESSDIQDTYYDQVRSLRKTMNEEIKKVYENQKKKLKKDDILNKIRKGINQKSIDIFLDKTKKFRFKGKTYPIGVRTTNSALNNILFVPTNFDKLRIYDVRFNLVNIVDLNTKQNPNQYVIFGNLSNGQIHMTTKSLYLVNRYYQSHSWRCPIGLGCIMPYYERGNFTLVHKLSVDGFNMNYVNSQIIPGNTINQYSMDEDSNGNFRIFTKYYYPTRATDLYIFNAKLELEGKIQGIAKGEDFKSSRFIEDKAYLVTFKATDPLFVIDVKDNKNPKIMGELKIPGYSLYLHPAGKVGSVQYLIGVGQEAEEVHGNRSLPKNIKIDVYKVDYSKKVKDVCSKLDGDKLVKCLKSANINVDINCDCPDGAKCLLDCNSLVLQKAKESKNWNNLYVEQLYSYTLGNEKKVGNGGSYTPVFNDPRTFVYDKNLKTLLLPVYLAEDNIEKKCYPKYTRRDSQRIQDGERCYENNRKTPYFIGVKGLKIDLEKGITEILSKNYINLYKTADSFKKIVGYGSSLNQRKYKSANHRVSYYRGGNDFVAFEMNIDFMDLFKGKEDKFIAFNPLFNTKIDKPSSKVPSKKCFYKKPAQGTITCQMFCGNRWILENNKCKKIMVSSACSCPGFDTENQCKENCIK